MGNINLNKSDITNNYRMSLKILKTYVDGKSLKGKDIKFKTNTLIKWKCQEERFEIIETFSYFKKPSLDLYEYLTKCDNINDDCLIEIDKNSISQLLRNFKCMVNYKKKKNGESENQDNTNIEEFVGGEEGKVD